MLILRALAQGAHALALLQSRATVYAFASAKLAEVESALAAEGEPRTSGSFRSGPTLFEWSLERDALPDEPRLELVTLVVAWRQGRQRYDARLSTVHQLAEAPDAS